MNQQHESIKLVPSLLPNADLSTKKIQVFINNRRSIEYNIVTDEMISQEILSLISGFKRLHQKCFHTGK